MDDDHPREPDLDALPDELRLHPGACFFEAVDPETGERYRQPITPEQLGTAFADADRFAE